MISVVKLPIICVRNAWQNYLFLAVRRRSHFTSDWKLHEFAVTVKTFCSFDSQLTTVLEHGIQNVQSGVHFHCSSFSSHQYLGNKLWGGGIGGRRRRIRRREEGEKEGRKGEDEEERRRRRGGGEEWEKRRRRWRRRWWRRMRGRKGRGEGDKVYKRRYIHVWSAGRRGREREMEGGKRTKKRRAREVGVGQYRSIMQLDHTKVLWHSWPGRQRLSHPCHSCWQNSPPNH